MAWSRYAFYHLALMGVVYVATLLSFAPFWNVIGCRPLFFLPIMFLAQVTQASTPWLILWAGFTWDSIAFWPIGLSCVFYLISTFSWPLWQRLVVNPYMIWGVFCMWSLVMHAGPWAYVCYTTGIAFPWHSILDIVFTVCCFPVFAVLWPFGRSQ